MQIGYFHNAAGELEPIHDEGAMKIALSVVADEQPDVVVMHGDNADLCELGKYRTTPAFAQTTQATIDRCALMAQQVRTAAPGARIVWLEGNHEARLPNYLLDNAANAFGLTRGRIGAAKAGWPVMSIPHLCHLDDAGIEYLSGYPANDLWLTDSVRIVHGNKVDSRGVTATKYLDLDKVSTYYGHIHRREFAQRTRVSRHGPRTTTAASFGCLCRIDGAVPSTNGGSDLFGRPVPTAENWQNGLGLIRFRPDSEKHATEHVEILGGWAMHRGQEYRA